VRAWALGLLALISATGYCALRPACVPIESETLARFDPPIETRDDRDLYLRVFQLRDGRWHQCKTWLSRQLFF
jgi:hypothetical protein